MARATAVMNDDAVLVSARDVIVDYSHPGRTWAIARQSFHAVAGVSFKIMPHETLGLVGESGCGKTSLGRALLGLVKLSQGTIEFKGQDIHAIKGAERRRVRRSMQVVFQNPYQSLNPRMRIGHMLSEPMIAHRLTSRREAHLRASELLALVGLSHDDIRRYPHEFSGGQRQRLAIARALAVDPEFLICDEPTSALDVSVRAQILNLLVDLREQMGLTFMLITHDLSMVSSMSQTLAVMYLGRIVEIGSTPDVYFESRHPYTRALISSVPIPEPVAERNRQRILLSGDVPSPLTRPAGCTFRPRCWLYKELSGPRECDEIVPELVDVQAGVRQKVACHFHTELKNPGGSPTSSAITHR
jgi:oligopeptide/dipeptide ABC transporter ATP-binding protein